jgi:hypothetical protein
MNSKSSKCFRATETDIYTHQILCEKKNAFKPYRYNRANTLKKQMLTN